MLLSPEGEEQINIYQLGVRLPTYGNWVDVPGSPFQVQAHLHDLAGSFRVRVRPAYSAYWTEFMSDKEAGETRIGDHWVECTNRNCPGCV